MKDYVTIFEGGTQVHCIGWVTLLSLLLLRDLGGLASLQDVDSLKILLCVINEVNILVFNYNFYQYTHSRSQIPWSPDTVLIIFCSTGVNTNLNCKLQTTIR